MIPLPLQLQIGAVIVIFSLLNCLRISKFLQRDIICIEVKQIIILVRIFRPCRFNKDTAGRHIRIIWNSKFTFYGCPFTFFDICRCGYFNTSPVSVLDTDIKCLIVRAFIILHLCRYLYKLSLCNLSCNILHRSGSSSRSVRDLCCHVSAGMLFRHCSDCTRILGLPVFCFLFKTAVNNDLIRINIVLGNNRHIVQIEVHEIIFLILLGRPGCLYKYENSGKIRILRNCIVGFNCIPLAFFHIHIPCCGVCACKIICPVLHRNVKFSDVRTCGVFYLCTDVKFLSRLYFSGQILHGAGCRICLIVHQKAAFSGCLIVRSCFHRGCSIECPEFPAVRTIFESAVYDQLFHLRFCFRSGCSIRLCGNSVYRRCSRIFRGIL